MNDPPVEHDTISVVVASLRTLRDGSPCPSFLADRLERIDADQQEKIRKLSKLDSESATYVEVPICMRTHFTGEPPYVGWKGLGLALTETLDERDELRAKLAACARERDWMRRNAPLAYSQYRVIAADAREDAK